jgi:four helix bundle protein
MNRQELEERTKAFHIKVIKLCSMLPKHVSAYEIARQLIRSAGSVAANYRATKRAKSTADFIYKIGVVLEEADESHYWLTVIRDAEICNLPIVEELVDEANQLTAIFASTSKTAKGNRLTRDQKSDIRKS